MNTRSHVSDLASDASESDSQDLFARHRPVAAVRRVQDPVTGKARRSHSRLMHHLEPEETP